MQDFSGQNLENHDFSGQDLSGANFEGAVLSRAIFTDAKLTSTNFSKATMWGTIFKNAKLDNANFSHSEGSPDFSNASLRGVNFERFYAEGANLSGADYTGANFAWARIVECSSLAYADMSYTNFYNAVFRDADCTSVDFSYANLRGASFLCSPTKNAYFYGADLSGGSQFWLRDALLDDATVLWLAVVEESDPKRIQSWVNRGALLTDAETLNSSQKYHVISFPETDW